MFRLLRDLRRQHVPVDGVGLQMHLSTNDAPTLRQVRRNMMRFESLGLEVDITEMDVRLRLPANGAELAQQARIYQEMLDACLAAPNCKSFALWGFTDKYSWIPGNFPGWGDALIFDADFQPKPAYRALVDRLRRRY